LSLLQQDKSSWKGVQETLGDLPPGKSIMGYLSLHDETFIDDEDLHKELLKQGFNDFASRGVGDSVATILGNNEDRLAMAHALLYSSKGYPAVYYRTVVGAPNDNTYFEAKVQERASSLQETGEAVDRKKAADTRDLDRGPVSLAEYENALKRGYKPATFVRALNALWDKNGSVRTDKLEEVANPDKGVWSCARHSMETDDAPLLQLFNLTNDKKTVELQVDDLERQLGWSMTDKKQLVDLLATEINQKAGKTEAGAVVHIPYAIENGTVKITLEPYQALYLER
jgi:glycosidase